MAGNLSDSQERQRELNEHLKRIAEALLHQLEERWEQLNGVDRILVSHLGKCVRTFSAVQLLVDAEYFEDGLCLLRVLVENTINIKYMTRTDPVVAARRYLDWRLLDAVRRAREQKFYRGTALYTPERERDLLKQEADIRAKYGPEFAALKKSPFGVPLDQRAKAADLERLYTFSYRITSRNVHTVDVAELRVLRNIMDDAERQQFLALRVDHLLSVSRYCIGTVVLWFDTQYKCGHEVELESLRAEDDFPVQF